MDLNRIIEGDALTVLKTMPDKLVQTVITSPPYWGLRDYGESGQLGLESTPEKYVARMVKIFAEVRRVLRDDGTLWLNMGDSYAGSWGNSGSREGGQRSQNTDRLDRKAWDGHTDRPPASFIKSKRVPRGKGRYGGGNMPATGYLKPKDLCGIPWRVAFALQADGWYLRSDIIWSKPNPMPESVTDRPTKAHEYMFLLTKKAKYYYDADAIREPSTGQEGLAANFQRESKEADVPGQSKRQHRIDREPTSDNGNRNRRTVWEIATQPFPPEIKNLGQHFATFPEKLVEPCILAGSNDRACGICGAAWERETKPSENYAKYLGKAMHDHKNDLTEGSSQKHPHVNSEYITLGFRPSCEHDNGDSRSIVLDPFGGAGTTPLVALKNGRNHITIELKHEYVQMIKKRLKPLGNRPLPQQEILKV